MLIDGFVSSNRPRFAIILGRCFMSQSWFHGPPVVVRVWAKAGRGTASRFRRRLRAGAEANATLTY
jgi:hypothetical protein